MLYRVHTNKNSNVGIKTLLQAHS